MKKIVKMSLATAIMMSAGVASLSAGDVEILSNVKAKGLIKSRYEMVDQTNANGTAPANANAFTNRLTVGASADLFGTDWLSAYAEMTNVSALNKNYNSLTNGQTAHATVNDAEQTRLTEAYIDAKYGKSKVRFGRQRINLDNQRFIGSVDWRQMPQTMDAVSFMDNTVNNLDIFASYITQRNTVFGNSHVNGSLDTRDLLANISYKVMPELKVTAYSYMIGSTGLTPTATNGDRMGHDTYGVALTGDIKAGSAKINYRAEYATQDKASMKNSGVNVRNDADADYMNLEVGANVNGVLFGLQYEELSGTNGTDGKTAFKTPYSTLHAHNGWADVFLGNGGTPLKGLTDANIMLGYTSKDFGTFKAIYHDFTSEIGSINYGTEVDAIYTRAIPGVKNLDGMLKYADYRAKDSVAQGNYTTTAIDRTVFWAMLTYAFGSK